MAWILPPKEERQSGIEFEWLDAVGKEVYLRVAQRGGYLQPEFDGIFAADDPRVPGAVRQGHATPLSVKPLAVKEEKAGAGKAQPASQPPAKPLAATAGNNNRPRVTTPAKPAPEDWSDL